MSCPSVRSKFKKILTFSNALDFSYEYDFSSEEPYIKNTTDTYVTIHQIRDNGIEQKPTIWFAYGYIMFADEPLIVNFTSPYFDKPQYTNYGSVVPGSFDVGKWFRPFNFEIQLWNPKGDIKFVDKEPLFYAELQTDRKVNVHIFDHTEKIERLSLACVKSTEMFGNGQTLLSRYNKFKNAGLREKILAQIKNNIVEENFLTI
jgi:hypothetical protein